MLTWIEDNQNLIVAIIALFGAGGAGTIVIKKLLSGKASDKNGAPVQITATASNGGHAIAHAGQGNASIEINRNVDLEQFETIAERHGLSPVHANRLIEAASEKGLDLQVICATSLDVESKLSLQSALETQDYDQVEALFQGQPNTNQDLNK